MICVTNWDCGCEVGFGFLKLRPHQIHVQRALRPVVESVALFRLLGWTRIADSLDFDLFDSDLIL